MQPPGPPFPATFQIESCKIQITAFSFLFYFPLNALLIISVSAKLSLFWHLVTKFTGFFLCDSYHIKTDIKIGL